jgi:signal transduction histidine kinase/CheY-like chemotaxis protein
MLNNIPLNAIVSELPEGGLKSALEVQDILSVLLMPIYVEDFFWGFVGFDDCQNEKIWSPSEVNLLRSLSLSISSAITRKTIEDNLRKSKEIAENANIAKTEFLANISHEIRTPLNGVIGFTSLLVNTPLNFEQNEFAQNLKVSAEILNDLITDILDFSKIDAGIIEISPKKTETKNFVSEIENIVRYQFSKENNRLEINVNPNVPEFLYIDATRLKQVLVNLLSNGSKFTAKGVIKLSIEVQNDTLHFSVSDNGIGMHQDQLHTIFDPFVQLDQSRTKKYAGTGLGLAICKKILQSMDSDIKVVSEYRKGSIFSFEIKNFASKDLIEFTNLAKMDNFKDTQSEGVNKEELSILIVDDNEMNIKLASLIVKKHFVNSKIFLSSTGTEALDKVKLHDFSIILLDLHMPDLDGWQTFEKMKEIRSNLCPVIALTADASENAREKCLEKGMNGILIKPFSQLDLSRIIKENTFPAVN